MVKMIYGQWEQLSEESQNKRIALGMLPDVPWADMENENLLVSQMIIVDGERCWEIRYKDETEMHIFPEIKQATMAGFSMQYKFNPLRGEYEIDHTVEEMKAGYYGMKWLEFMENHYPKIYRQLEKKQTLYAVAQSVNESAREYKRLLDRQYEQAHLRPYEFADESEHSSWRFTRNFYTDHEVMVDCVLIKRTTV
jgi:hypothetical protein